MVREVEEGPFAAHKATLHSPINGGGGCGEAAAAAAEREVEEGPFTAHKATPIAPSMVVVVAVVRRRSGGEGG